MDRKDMEKEGYYSSGTFAKMAHVSKKTLRYYKEHNILKPSFVAENGAGFYTDNDFAKLQQIIFLKYLSFPLDDIKELTVRHEDKDFWLESLKMQTSLLESHIQQMSLMKNVLHEAQEAIESGQQVNWRDMLLLANSNEMEQRLKQQYLNSSNISARIQLHTQFSRNQEGWFRWLYRSLGLREGEQVLELGCGDGALWQQNSERIPKGCSVLLTDISDGILRETQKKLMEMEKQNVVGFRVMDAHYINADENTYDVVIANHMLFYCGDLSRVFSEIRRVLKPGGRLVCSTYSTRHMQEISQLVKEFDDRIALAANRLYDIFGKENGERLLAEYFDEVKWLQYVDELCVTKPEPLIAYIMSCHGNQNRYIVDKYQSFYGFVKKKTQKGFEITKDAGVFVARIK